MVNTGRPSRGCNPCKERHTKCDERRPECSRCKKAGRKCTGYKFDFDINHRNETNIVAQRVLAREANYQHVSKSLPIPYEQQAVALFIENFVLHSPDARYSKGYLTGLLPLLQTAKADSLLCGVVEAVGLCFLATSTINDSIASRAGRGYSRSLRCLRARLDQDAHCVSPETMLSVYLMGLYEVSTQQKNVILPLTESRLY
ncbi:hypothetical protein K402DRAFT_323361 [Aulographum hederae CBS 113979]|uniref:Zn(2)-C6 fungal-type domain-containing protein n=1 Tax=Aulographum hederae CBS 113979 TaxID=1176131 RepID=A0A6G1HD05_9PEZI|nr:hypothetical protein K402DRAFT_323361 [Aulographum hederae CBS 113979]